MIPLNWKLRLPLSHFQLLMSLNQQAKKGTSALPMVIDTDYQGVHSREKEEHVRSTGDLLGQLLLLYLVVKVSGKLQPKSGRTTNDPDPLQMKVWVTSPSEVP